MRAFYSGLFYPVVSGQLQPWQRKVILFSEKRGAYDSFVPDL